MPAVTTLDELEVAFNAAFSDLDWGFVVITLEDSTVALRQHAFPGHLMNEHGAEAWRRAFAAVLEGVFMTWLREVRVKNDTAPDVLELAYGA